MDLLGAEDWTGNYKDIPKEKPRLVIEFAHWNCNSGLGGKVKGKRLGVMIINQWLMDKVNGRR